MNQAEEETYKAILEGIVDPFREEYEVKIRLYREHRAWDDTSISYAELCFLEHKPTGMLLEMIIGVRLEDNDRFVMICKSMTDYHEGRNASVLLGQPDSIEQIAKAINKELKEIVSDGKDFIEVWEEKKDEQWQ